MLDPVSGLVRVGERVFALKNLWMIRGNKQKSPKSHIHPSAVTAQEENGKTSDKDSLCDQTLSGLLSLFLAGLQPWPVKT